MLIAGAVALFKGEPYLLALHKENKDLRTAQKLSDARIDSLNKIIEARDVQIADIDGEREESRKRRKRIEGNLPKIDEKFERDIAIIASDDAIADFWAIGDIFKGHDINN